MKVVNEKGRLFGKLNIIDLLAILLILIIVIFAGVKLLGGGKSEPTPTTAGRLTYTVRVTAQRAELADWISDYVDITTGKRDQLMASGEMLDAYIVDFKTEPTRYNTLYDGSIVFFDKEEAEQHGLVDICFVIQASSSDAVLGTVGPQEVRVGRSHIVKTTHMEFSSGMIETCTWE